MITDDSDTDVHGANVDGQRALPALVDVAGSPSGSRSGSKRGRASPYPVR